MNTYTFWHLGASWEGDHDTSPKWEFTDQFSYSCSSSSSSYKEKTDPYADGYAFRPQDDINPHSFWYGERRWIWFPDWDYKCKGQTDTSPTWEYIDSSSYSCSSSSSSYREKSDIYADGYAFRKQKDTNPDSDTYRDTRWVRYSSWDSKCVGEERPVDRTPHWETTSILGCSSSSSSYKEKTDPYADGYAFVKYKDTNPNSPSYNDIEWRRTSYMDDQCVGEERPYQPTYTFTAEDYDVTGDSSIDITSYKTVEEGGTTHVQWTVDEITGDGAEFIEKAVSAGGNTSLTIKIKEGTNLLADGKAVITLKQSESGKTIEINVTIKGTGHVDPPASNDMFAPCDRKYVYDLNCDFRPINIPICSVYNNQSAKPMVHGYEGRLFDYVRIEEGAGLVIGWSSEAIKSTEDFSTAIILQQEGSGKEFEIKFNVTPCPPPPYPAL